MYQQFTFIAEGNPNEIIRKLVDINTRYSMNDQNIQYVCHNMKGTANELISILNVLNENVKIVLEESY